jgi:anti-anti-sigma factor
MLKRAGKVFDGKGIFRRRAHRHHLAPVLLHSFEELTSSGTPVTLVECIGRLTAPQAQRLCDNLLMHLSYGPRHLLLDLSAVASMDQIVTGLLRDVARQSRASHCTFGLIAPSQAAQRRLAASGLNRTLDIDDDLTHALTRIQTAGRKPYW